VTYVDNSLLSTTLCDTRALLRHHHGLVAQGAEPAYFTAGRAAHEAHAVWLRGGTPAEALAKFAAEYEAVGAALPDDRLSYRNTAAILEAFYERMPREALPFTVEPEMVEVGFQLPLTDGVTFYGRLDAVVLDKRTGKLAVLDWKHPRWARTTEGRSYFDDFRNDAQMSGYVWAAQETFGEPVTGVWIGAIEFSRLPWWNEPQRRCRAHGLTYGGCRLEHAFFELRELSRSPGQVRAWHENAVRLARRYQELLAAHPTLADLTSAGVQGMFYHACPRCEFRDFCESERPVQWAHSVLEHRPWRPFEE
jgi:hypothetical protein